MVDFVGDNFLAEFPSALAAARAATELQRMFAERNRGAPPEAVLVWRMGVHLGDVQVEGGRLYGDGINVAARLEGLAEPGGVCVSDDVYRQIRGRRDSSCVDLGEHEAKGSPEPIRVWRLALAEAHSG